MDAIARLPCVSDGIARTESPAPIPAPMFASVVRLLRSPGFEVSEGNIPQYEISFIV